jgi:hypothetical protein
MSKVTLKQKEYFIGKFRDFLSNNISLYITVINGEKIDVQKVFNEWLEKEFNYKSK